MKNRSVRWTLICANLLLAASLAATPARADDVLKGCCKSEVGTTNKYCCITCQCTKDCNVDLTCTPKVE